jgi:hypothetical protein
MLTVMAIVGTKSLSTQEGGCLSLPQHVTRVRIGIDESVKEIIEYAFYGKNKLLEVETHDGITKVGREAFAFCTFLRGIKLPGVRIIERLAFEFCNELTDVELGDKLETIGLSAFSICCSLSRLTIPSVRTIASL